MTYGLEFTSSSVLHSRPSIDPLRGE